jgi:hypothetical protein
VNNAYPEGCIIVAFLTPSQISFRALRIDEDVITDLQIRGMRSDWNYRSVREYSRREFAKAKKSAVLYGNVPKVDWEGCKFVMLDSKRYRFTLEPMRAL